MSILILLLLLVGCGPAPPFPPPAIPAAAYADIPPQEETLHSQHVKEVEKAQPVKEAKTVDERLDHLEGQLSWMKKRLGGNK